MTNKNEDNSVTIQTMDNNKSKQLTIQTKVIAQSALFKETLEADCALENNPTVGQNYFVTVNRRSNLLVDMEICLFYEAPKVSFNGYENEEEIELASFCDGKILKIISQNELSVTFEFLVSKVTTFQDLLVTQKTEELLKYWTDYFMCFLERADYSLETFGKYYELIVSAEGDSGQSCIFTEYENEFIICILNEWNYTKNEIYGGKFPLPENIKKILKM